MWQKNNQNREELFRSCKKVIYGNINLYKNHLKKNLVISVFSHKILWTDYGVLWTDYGNVTALRFPIFFYGRDPKIFW